MNKHYEYLCKYDPGTALPAIAFRRCDRCDAFLCPTCGYSTKAGAFTWNFCNECYPLVRAEEAKFPPQGEPGGDERDLPEQAAIEAEQSSHVHP